LIKIPDFSFFGSPFTNHIMLHIGHKYNNVQADGGIALRVDLFQSNKQKTTKLMNFFLNQTLEITLEVHEFVRVG